jgi:hypothetical protein
LDRDSQITQLKEEQTKLKGQFEDMVKTLKEFKKQDPQNVVYVPSPVAKVEEPCINDLKRKSGLIKSDDLL